MKTLLLFLVSLFAPATLSAGGTIPTELPRLAKFPKESYPGIETIYGVLPMEDGTRLRTITTFPAEATGKLPAILDVAWVSCDSVELDPNVKDGWSLMMRRLITGSNMLVMRMDKSGVGDSVGVDCSKLDYDTEIKHYRAALKQLFAHPKVDPSRVIVLGLSMGATMAPLVAQGHPVRGIAVWGGGARTWFERMIALDRRVMELSGRKPEEVAAAMQRHVEFHTRYLLHGMSPESIAAKDAKLGAVWKDIVGTQGSLHYGRPIAYHHQAQNHDWAAAWAKIDAPVLAMLGEYDYFEEPRSAEWIARTVNRRKPGQAEFHLIPKMDHHFSVYSSPEAAFAERDGRAEPGDAVNLLLDWLKRIR